MTSYLEALRQAAILFPIIAVAFTIPYIAFNYHKYGSILSLRAVIVYTFILYLLCVYCLVILPLPSPEAAAQLHGHKAQLVPFAFVGDILRNCDFQWSRPETWLSVLGTSAFLTTAFNLLMTMPFGVYLRYYFQCRWFKTLALSFLLSLFFEVTQLTGLYFLYPGSYRLFDVDDLMVNTLGGMIGYGGRAGRRFLPSRNEIDRASFVRGHQVSFLRRLVALVYDAVAAAVLSGVLILALAALSLPRPHRLRGSAGHGVLHVRPRAVPGADHGTPADPAAGGDGGGGAFPVVSVHPPVRAPVRRPVLAALAAEPGYYLSPGSGHPQ